MVFFIESLTGTFDFNTTICFVIILHNENPNPIRFHLEHQTGESLVYERLPLSLSTDYTLQSEEIGRFVYHYQVTKTDFLNNFVKSTCNVIINDQTQTQIQTQTMTTSIVLYPYILSIDGIYDDNQTLKYTLQIQGAQSDRHCYLIHSTDSNHQQREPSDHCFLIKANQNQSYTYQYQLDSEQLLLNNIFASIALYGNDNRLYSHRTSELILNPSIVSLTHNLNDTYSLNQPIIFTVEIKGASHDRQCMIESITGSELAIQQSSHFLVPAQLTIKQSYTYIIRSIDLTQQMINTLVTLRRAGITLDKIYDTKNISINFIGLDLVSIKAQTINQENQYRLTATIRNNNSKTFLCRLVSLTGQKHFIHTSLPFYIKPGLSDYYFDYQLDRMDLNHRFIESGIELHLIDQTDKETDQKTNQDIAMKIDTSTIETVPISIRAISLPLLVEWTGYVTDQTLPNGVVRLTGQIYNPMSQPITMYLHYWVAHSKLPEPTNYYDSPFFIIGATSYYFVSIDYVIKSSDTPSIWTQATLYAGIPPSGSPHNTFPEQPLEIDLSLNQIVSYYGSIDHPNTVTYTINLINNGPNSSYYLEHSVSTGSPKIRLPTNGYLPIGQGSSTTYLPKPNYTITETDLSNSRLTSAIYVYSRVNKLEPPNVPSTIYVLSDLKTAQIALPEPSIELVSYQGTILDFPIDLNSRIKYQAIAQTTDKVPIFHLTVVDQLTNQPWTPNDFRLPRADGIQTQMVDNSNYYYRISDSDLNNGFIESTVQIYASVPANIKSTATTAVMVKPAKIQSYFATINDQTVKYQIIIYNNLRNPPFEHPIISTLTVRDNLLPSWSQNISQLQPVSSVLVTRNYQIQPDDYQLGYITSMASVTTTIDGIDYFDQSAPYTVVVRPLSIVDYTSVPDSSTAIIQTGTHLIYTGQIKNKLNINLSNIKITDTKSTLKPPTTFNLDPQAIQESKGDYYLTSNDLNQGYLVSRLTATVKINNTTFTESRDLTVWTAPVQIVSYEGFIEALPIVLGTKIIYHAVIRNLSNHPLSNINVVDPRTLFNQIIPLLEGLSQTLLTHQYLITQSDLDQGLTFIQSTLTTSMVVQNLIVDLDTNPETRNVKTDSSNLPSISKSKSPLIYQSKLTTVVQFKYITMTYYQGTVPTGLIVPNTPITYTIRVKNNVLVDLTNVFVEDLGDISSQPWNHTIAILPQTGIQTLTRTYHVEQSNINNGGISSTARAQVVAHSTLDLTQRSTFIPIEQIGQITLTKYFGQLTGAIGLNEPVTYTFEVTNTGNLIINNLLLTDTLGYSDLIGTITPTSKITRLDDYLIQRPDIDLGFIESTVNVEGNYTIYDVSYVARDQRSTVTQIGRPPSIQLLEYQYLPSFPLPTIIRPGDYVTYQFQISNAGDYDLIQTTLIEQKEDGTPMSNFKVGQPPNYLIPAGQSVTVTHPYMVSQEDVNAGQIISRALGNATFLDTVLTSNTLETRVIIELQPKIKIIDYHGQVSDSEIVLGVTRIIYHLTIENVGNLILSDLIFRDSLKHSVPLLPSQTLHPNDQRVIDHVTDHLITEQDINNEFVKTYGIVLGKSLSGTIDDQMETTVTLGKPPQITLELYQGQIIKSRSTDGGGGVGIGIGVGASREPILAQQSIIVYTYRIHNVSDYPLSQITIEDITDIAVVRHTIHIETLLPNEIREIQWEYQITQEDIDRCYITSTARVTGHFYTIVVQVPEQTITVNLETLSNIKVDKRVTQMGQTVGENINYLITIINDGNSTLHDIHLFDQMLAIDRHFAILQPIHLDPETNIIMIHGHYQMTDEDFQRGYVSNTVIVESWDVIDHYVSNYYTLSTPIPINRPSIHLFKEALNVNQDFNQIVYRLVVTNNGNVNLHQVHLYDQQLDLDIVTSLRPQQSASYQRTYTITTQDLRQKHHINTAYVTGLTPTGNEISDEVKVDTVLMSSSEHGSSSPPSSIYLSKVATSIDDRIGGIIKYRLTIYNNGWTNLDQIHLIDHKLNIDQILDLPSSLAPRGQYTMVKDYQITSNEYQEYLVTNRASVTALDQNHNQVESIAEIKTIPCVVRDTMILMLDGSLKPIQDIKRDDIVGPAPGYRVARLCQTEIDCSTIVDLIIFEPNSLGPNQPSQQLIITSNHPIFYHQKRYPSHSFVLFNGVLHVKRHNINCLYDLQFEKDGSYIANGIEIQSCSPYSALNPLPKELYFNQSLYTEEFVWDQYLPSIELSTEILKPRHDFYAKHQIKKQRNMNRHQLCKQFISDKQNHKI
ncbi:MAG: hypothetical protein ABIN35_01135 [candidate division WOR-3 bacterium]